MYARVTHVQGTPDKIDAGIESFKSKVVPACEGVDGYKGSLMLVDRSSGKGIGFSLWASEEARVKGGEAVEAARAATIGAMGGTVPDVEEYEVGFSNL